MLFYAVAVCLCLVCQSEEPSDAQEQYKLGLRYYKGEGMAKQPVEAVKWYRKSADQGFAKAQNNLGLCYHLGEGVAKDAVEAVKWYRKAADQGFALAQVNLGICYSNGEGVARNPVEAVKLYRKAVDQGCSQAQVNLGNAYCDGNGVEKNYVEAVKLFRKAAEQGDASGQHGLGLCYYLGEGVAKDAVEAARWYLKAAEQGDAKAQNCLGNCYSKGEGVAKDESEAVRWWRKAAEQGNVQAQKSLRSHGGFNAAALPRPGVIEAPKGEKLEIPAAGPGKTAAVTAENFSDQEDVVPCILPISGKEPVDSVAGWALGLGSEPGPMLDAMEGGRPGGDVTAMMVLLRQAGGPLSEEEDKAMNRKWAPYAASKSPKAHKAIRKQSELLLQSMVNRQTMVQAAWEYDFAVAQRQLAIFMKDNEEADAAEMMAELQQQVAENAKKNLDSLSAEIDKAPDIPTPEELKAEDDAERKNALDALSPGKETVNPAKPGKVLLGYLKHVKTTAEVKSVFKARLKNNPAAGVCDVTENSANTTIVTHWDAAKQMGTGKQLKEEDDIVKFECTWQTPGMIPVYAGGDDENYFPFNIAVKDTGTSFSSRSMKKEVRVGVSYKSARWCKEGILDVVAPGGAEAKIDKLPLEYHYADQTAKNKIIDDQVVEIDNMAVWHATIRYKFEPASGSEKPEPTKQDSSLGADKNDQIAEHGANIAAAKRAIDGIRKEMAAETDKDRREALRLQCLHLEQDVHDSKDLIESIRTGTLVKTRGPWDEHATAVMARTSMKLVEDCKRAQQMQASFVRMTKMLEKYKPDEARKLYESLRIQMVQGIYQPGGLDKAQKALDAVYGSASSAVKESQKQNYADLDVRKAQLERAEWNLAVAEGVKKNCDRAIFAGTLFTGMAPGLALSMVYEGSCTAVEKGPKEALKNAVVQGGVMLLSMGTMKAGGWAIGKFLNPKVAQSEVNSFRKILDAKRHQQEMEWNQALVNRLKDKAGAMEKCKAAGGKDYLKIRAELDDAVVAANSSSLAKNIMKNEFVAAEKTLAEKGGREAAAALSEINSYQGIYNSRLQNSIYPRTDAQLVKTLNKQGYNVESGWFREFRNATSRGANRDRDLGLLAEMEGKLTKNGKSVSLNEFMDDGQKAYNASYKQVTGRSAVLADQNITTSVHSESFPLKWLEQKVGDAGDPRDFEKAGSAIYNKVRNAMAGPDPAFVNLKKACSSLGKDLKTKVLKRLENPPAGSTISSTSRQAAIEHWSNVQKVMDDFASDKIDPLTAMKKLQQLTGSTSVTQSAAEVQRMMGRLGGAVK
ncbi:MAG: hypothetical protein A2X45_01655 [Lentisphaerae bacterium GWF2_50_93]|nr:MAG: hypothetical protein A2X45_01655 [Lentisphaerae bacterium GWF2_50_93]